MMKISSAVLLLLGLANIASAQQSAKISQPKLTSQTSGTTQLLISVSPVNDRIVWAAGTGGTYAMTKDGGETWKSAVVPGAEALQFRDVKGVTDKIAYLMSIGDNTTDFRIYKTGDGGTNWTIEFTNQNPLAFWTPRRGITHSDSGNGIFPDIRTTDGLTWQSISANMPPALPGEASFAASGTCITTDGENNAWITTGGSTIARILATKDGGNTWHAFNTSLVSSPSAGGVSVAFRDARHGIGGGGDPASNASAETATSDDGGQTWFTLIGVSGFWVVGFANSKAGWFVGNNGAILKISF